MEQIQEIEREEAMQTRKDLFEQRKKQKHKIAQLAGQVEAISMVGILLPSCVRTVLLCVFCVCLSMTSGVLTTRT